MGGEYTGDDRMEEEQPFVWEQFLKCTHHGISCYREDQPRTLKYEIPQQEWVLLALVKRGKIGVS